MTTINYSFLFFFVIHSLPAFHFFTENSDDVLAFCLSATHYKRRSTNYLFVKLPRRNSFYNLIQKLTHTHTLAQNLLAMVSWNVVSMCLCHMLTTYMDKCVEFTSTYNEMKKIFTYTHTHTHTNEKKGERKLHGLVVLLQNIRIC